MKVFDEITLQYDKDGNLCSDPSRKTSNITEKDCSEDEIEHTVKQQVFVDHCIMDTPDSALSQELVKQKNDIVVNKGSNPEVKMLILIYFAFCPFFVSHLRLTLIQHSLTMVALKRQNWRPYLTKSKWVKFTWLASR